MQVTKPPPDSPEARPKTLSVPRISSATAVDARWDQPAWAAVPPQTLTFYMGEKPDHAPRVQFRIAYDDRNIRVIWRVEDRYVRAAASAHQACVCVDSCVEFFMRPDPESISYLNLEMNCGGTMLINNQPEGKPAYPIPSAELEAIEVAASLPRIVDPEIREPTVWTLEYRLPVAMIKRHLPAVTPAPGARWQANFYKCADLTSHPHWLTWSFMDFARPSFHIPKAFGLLEFA